MAIDSTTPRTRRAILAGGLAAAAAASLERAQPASAHDPDDVQLGAPNSATSPTSITNTATDGHAFRGNASGDGYGVYGSSPSGYGVYGISNGGGTGVGGRAESGFGVNGDSYSGTGVNGISARGTGVSAFSGPGTGVSGVSSSGVGVYGITYSTTLPAVLGRAGANTGVQGYSGTNPVPASPAKTGVQGYADTDEASVGVRGRSPTGRGALFGGKLAQLRLSPSKASTHPASGQRGDFFVDSSGRLWFCKGGTTWVQLA